jgi:hypothetical protein
MAGHLRDAATLISPAVRETIAALAPGTDGAEADAAAVSLALQYARVIDESQGHCRGCDDGDCRRGLTSAWLLRWIGPLLLESLVQLGATPAARAAIGKKGKPAARNGLEALRDTWTA